MAFYQFEAHSSQSLGNRILKTVVAPLGIAFQCATKTAPVPVDRVFSKSGEALN